jgi:DNA-binding IclR family transcriptional regulator
VGRTVGVLNYLADHPGMRFSLTSIAGALGFNEASCRSMLTELGSHGMVIRYQDKTYSLGPALVNLGTAATLDEAMILDIARRELVAIHEELELSCIATRLVDGQIEIAARRDVQRPLIDYAPVGYRMKNRPPHGQEFMAWAPRARVERWLDRLPRELWAEQRSPYYERLESVRSAGYRATILDDVRALRVLLHRLYDYPGAATMLREVDARAFGPFNLSDYDPPLSAVTRFKAPIFDPIGRVVLVLSVGQFPPYAELAEVRVAIDRLLQGTRRVTESLHGVEPVPDWLGELPASPGGPGERATEA